MQRKILDSRPRLIRLGLGLVLTASLPSALLAAGGAWHLLSYGIWAPAIITTFILYLILYLMGFVPLDRPEKSRAYNKARSACLGAVFHVSSFSLLLLFDSPFLLPLASAFLAAIGAISGILFWLIVYDQAEPPRA